MLSNQKLFSVGNFDFRLQHLLVIGVLVLSVSISMMIRSTPASHGFELFEFDSVPTDAKTLAIIMDAPDAMKAVGKVWVQWLTYHNVNYASSKIEGKTDFGEIGYGGPAPPDGRHTYIFKAYALDTELELKEGYSKQELEDVMKDHILAEAKLTGTFAP